MPRTLVKVEDLANLFPKATRIYVAHIEGVDIQDMVAASRRLADCGYRVMPHFPARIIKDLGVLERWIKSYSEDAGVSEALLLAGSPRNPLGSLENSMQLLDTGLFDKYGFGRLHVAGHPEGNKDIDQDTSGERIAEALRWKQRFSQRTDAQMAVVTQFSFSATSVVRWAESLKKNEIDLPIHVGVAGPTKLQTLIYFAISCGVGPSIQVLQKRAADLSKLLLPYEPTDVLLELAAQLDNAQKTNISNIHFFPLGGIQATADWLKKEQKQ